MKDIINSGMHFSARFPPVNVMASNAAGKEQEAS